MDRYDKELWVPGNSANVWFNKFIYHELHTPVLLINRSRGYICSTMWYDLVIFSYFASIDYHRSQYSDDLRLLPVKQTIMWHKNNQKMLPDKKQV